MKKLKIAGIALLVATVVFIFVVGYCYAKAKESAYPWGMWIRAGKLSDEPIQYVEVPENVDEATKKALENPYEWTYVEHQEICWAHGHLYTAVKYKGEYYGFGLLFRDGPPIKDIPEWKVVEYSPIGFTILGATGAVLGVVWYKTERTKNVAGC